MAALTSSFRSASQPEVELDDHYLVALAKERHFARAAASCNISQPAMSAAIRQLEEELGVMLVERDKRFNGFTPEGQEVLLWARRMLADEESLRQGIHNAQRSLTGNLKLGVIPSALPLVPATWITGGSTRSG